MSLRMRRSAGGELIERGLLLRQTRRARAAPNEKRRQRGADVLTPSRDRSDAVDDLGRGVVLQHVAAHAQIERGVEIVLVFVHRQKDEGGRQAAFADLARDGKAVFDRHRDVEHRDGDVAMSAGVRGPDRRPMLRPRR